MSENKQAELRWQITGGVAIPRPKQARSSPRTPRRVPCRIRTSSSQDGRAMSLMGETVDMSAEGLSVRLPKEVPTGTRVEVLIPHLDGEPTCLYGRVTRNTRVLTGTYEIGVHLAAPDAEDTQ